MNRDHYLMRMTVPTDVSDDDPEYRGSFSDGFRISEGSQVIAADWSVRGEVTITYLKRGKR